MTPHAILTGDLIGSNNRSAKQITDTLSALKDFWQKFASLHKGHVLGGLEVFRGDGWQAALASPAFALDAAVFLRAVVKACPQSLKSDTRIGIGIGAVSHWVEGNLGESQGEAFVASGHALDSLSGTKRCWALLPDSGHYRPLSNMLLPALDLAVTRWTAAEAFAVVGEILEWTQEETAAHPWALKKDGTAPTPQAIGDAIRRTHWKTHLLPVFKECRNFLDLQETSQKT